jgi:hypothetical protein
MRARFTEEQIIVILRQPETSVSVSDPLQEARAQLADVLQLEDQVRRHGWVRSPATEGA